MKKKLFIVTFAVTSVVCFAQQTERKTVVKKSRTGTIESVEFSDRDQAVQIPATADVFFKNMLKTRSSDEFRKIPHKSKRKEFAHEHFDQYYKGIKVDGAGYNFHYREGKMYFAHGRYVEINEMQTKPSLTAKEAEESFARYKNIPLKSVTDYVAELLIKEIPVTNDTVPMLVYKIYLYADHDNNTETGYIDAQSGKVVLTERVLINYGATGTFVTRYSGTQSGVTHHYGGSFHLVDSTANRAVIHTWNLNGSINFNDSVELSDNDNNWTQAEHAANNNNMGLDIHWALQQIRN